MTESEKLFHQIASNIPLGIEGTMFGAKCIKSVNGKTAAFFWQNKMVFKLDKSSREEALKMPGAKVGAHLYAPEKQMKGWISIPDTFSDKWADYTSKALNYVAKLK